MILLLVHCQVTSNQVIPGVFVVQLAHLPEGCCTGVMFLARCSQARDKSFGQLVNYHQT